MKYRIETMTLESHTWSAFREYSGNNKSLASVEPYWKEAIMEYPERNIRLISLTDDGIVYEVLRFKEAKRGR